MAKLPVLPYKTYEFMPDNPIWIVFPRSEYLQDCDMISQSIILHSKEPRTHFVEIEYDKNEENFRVEPEKFNIKANHKIQLRIIWSKTSNDPLRAVLRFRSKENTESKTYFIICSSDSTNPTQNQTSRTSERVPADSQESPSVLDELREIEVGQRLRNIKLRLIEVKAAYKESSRIAQQELVLKNFELNFSYLGNLCDLILKNFFKIYGDSGDGVIDLRNNPKNKKSVKKLADSNAMPYSQMNSLATVELSKFKFFAENLYDLRCAIDHNKPSACSAYTILQDTMRLIKDNNSFEIYQGFLNKLVNETKGKIFNRNEFFMYAPYIVLGAEMHERIYTEELLKKENEENHEEQ